MESGDLSRIPDSIPRMKEILVDGSVFTIHCYRFAAKSEFFQALLSQNFKEKNQRMIEIHGIEHDVFSKVHQLFNTGRVDLRVEEAATVYSVCRYFLIKEPYLRDLQNFIIENLQIPQIYDFLEYCALNNDPLLSRVASILAIKIEELYRSSFFHELSVDAMLAVVTNKQIRISQEDSICWIVAEWLSQSFARKSFSSKILRKISPTKIDTLANLNQEDWANVTAIADSLYYGIFELQPRVSRPVKSEFFKPDEPLYASNESGMLLITHFEGTEWSILDAPRTPLSPSVNILAAARKQSDLYVATSQLVNSPRRFETNVLHYNFRSKKMVELNKPDQSEIKGLHFCNQQLFSNTRDIVQQYCPEHDLWLNPIDIGLSHFQFAATDSESLFVCGLYDYSNKNSVHFWDPRSPEWIYFADVPQDCLGCCGTFVGNDLFMVALGTTVRDWRIFKFDVRNENWQTVTSHWARNSATPVSIRQCRNNLVIMDHYLNVHITPINGGYVTLREYYQFPMKPVYSLY